MDHPAEIPTLVMVLHCFCNGCTKKVKKLEKKICQVRLIEFDAEKSKVTVFGAVDPATVTEELAKERIKPKILWEERSPAITKKVQQKKIQVLSPKETLVPKRQQQQKQHLDLVPHHHQRAAVTGILVSDKSISKHKHGLELKFSNKRFTCDGCKEDGFNSRYRCEGCNFDLHEECNSPKSTIFPDLLERYAFEFFPKPPPDDAQRLCDGCGRNINGFFYHCKAKGLDLHPCCAKLKARVRNGETILQLREKVSSNCMWCKKKKPPGADPKVGGWSYVSGCKKYNIHIHCVTQILHEAWQKGAMTIDDESSMALEAIDLQRMAIPKGKGGGRRDMEFLKIIGIFRTIVGILFGDPTVFLGSLMLEVLKQLL